MSDHHHIRGDSFCSDREGAIDVEDPRGQRMIRDQAGILRQRSGGPLLRDRLLQLHALRIFRIVVAQCGGSAEDQLIDRQTKLYAVNRGLMSRSEAASFRMGSRPTRATSSCKYGLWKRAKMRSMYA